MIYEYIIHYEMDNNYNCDIQRKVTRATRRSRVSDSEEKNGEKKDKKRKRVYVQLHIVPQSITSVSMTVAPWKNLAVNSYLLDKN